MESLCLVSDLKSVGLRPQRLVYIFGSRALYSLNRRNCLEIICRSRVSVREIEEIFVNSKKLRPLFFQYSYRLEFLSRDFMGTFWTRIT